MAKKKKSEQNVPAPKSITHDPPDANAVYERALVLMEQGKIQDAIAEFDQAITLDANFGNAYLQRGLAYKKWGEVEKSIEDFTRAIDVLSEEADLASAYYNRSIARANFGELEESYVDLDKATALNPQLATGYSILGVSKRDADKTTQSEIEHKPAFVVDPEDVPAGTSEDLDHQGPVPQPNEELPQALEAKKTGPSPDESVQPAHDGADSPANPGLQTAGRTRPEDAKEYFNQGLAHLHERKYEKAVAKFDQAIHLDGNFTAAFFQRGIARHGAGSLEAAISDYDQAVSLDPVCGEAYLQRGKVYVELSEWDRAIADFDQAVAILAENEDKIEAYFQRGLLWYQKNDTGKAIANFDQVIALDPDHARAYNARGNAYNEQGVATGNVAWAKAIGDYNRAISLDRKYAAAYFNRGNAQYELGELDQAITSYSEAISYFVDETDRADAHYNRALAYFERRELAKAISDNDKAIRSFKDESDKAKGYNNRGLANFGKGNYKEAISDYTHAIRHAANGPVLPILYRNRANALIEARHLDEALSDCQKALEIEPRNPNTFVRLGQIHYRLGNHQEAINSYKNAERFSGSPTKFNLEIALSKLCLEQTGAAFGHIRNALGKAPERGYLETILGDYRALKEKQPDLPGVHRAMQMVQEALEWNSDNTAV